MKKRICALMLVMAVMGTMCACGLEPKSGITDGNNVTDGNSFTDDANYESEPEAEEPKADSFDVVYSDKHDFDEADLAMTFEQVKEIYKNTESCYESSKLEEEGNGEIKYSCTFEGIPGSVKYCFKNGQLVLISFVSEESENYNEYHEKMLAYANEHCEEYKGNYTGVSPANDRQTFVDINEMSGDGNPKMRFDISPAGDWDDILN